MEVAEVLQEGLYIVWSVWGVLVWLLAEEVQKVVVDLFEYSP